MWVAVSLDLLPSLFNSGGVGSQLIQVGRNHFQGAISSQRLDDIHEQGKGRGRRLKRDNVSQILARGGVRGDV